MKLRDCPSCERHIRIDEASCPFCASALPQAFREPPAPPRAPDRLKRAVLVGAAAAVTACSDAVTPVYGAPSDASVQSDTSSTDGAPDTSVGPVYGLPADGGSD
jgi:hypothetical protein